MIIDTDKTVSMTEANQNFSKVARMAMEYGDVTILKNNKVFLTVHYAPQDDSVKAASDADVLASSEKLLKRNRHVYEELAKWEDPMAFVMRECLIQQSVSPFRPSTIWSFIRALSTKPSALGTD